MPELYLKLTNKLPAVNVERPASINRKFFPGSIDCFGLFIGIIFFIIFFPDTPGSKFWMESEVFSAPDGLPFPNQNLRMAELGCRIRSTYERLLLNNLKFSNM